MKRTITLALVSARVLAFATDAAVPGRANAKVAFKVRSSVDGTKVFGRRVHWVAYPTLASSKIRAVEFRIDGRLSWVEHHPPYTYGGLDGDNYLITSWLAPGLHRFQVVAFGPRGAKAFDTVTARVLPTPPPPAAIAGVWTSTHPGNAEGTTPAGVWTLTVDEVGWRITDPARGGNLIDALYRSPGNVTLRTGIWTHPHSTSEGNGWCEDTNVSVAFKWSVSGDTLTLVHQGLDGCGESDILDGDWTRVA